MRTQRWVIGTVVVGALLIVACGGGGGDGDWNPPPPTPDPVVLDGLYMGGGFGLGSAIAMSGWGAATASSDEDSVDVHLNMNTGGAIVTPPGPTHYDAGVVFDRILGLRDPLADYSLSGPLLYDGAFGFAAMGYADRDACLLIALSQHGAGFSPANLSGDYILCGLSVDPTTGLSIAQAGTLNFDGVGSFSGSGLENRGGVYNPSITFGTGSYDVSDGGVVSLSFMDTIPTAGMLVNGGAAALLFGATIDTHPPGIYALIRAGSGRSEALLAPAYTGVRIVHGLAGGATEMFSGDFIRTADDPVYEFVGREDTGGLLIDHWVDAGTIQVFDSGVVFSTSGTRGGQAGGITADGRFLALVGNMQNGDPRVLYLLGR